MRTVLLLVAYLLCVFCLPAQKMYDSLLEKGIEYHDARQYNQAIGIYKEILQQDSTIVEAIYELSLSLLESGRYEEAISCCDKLIDRDDKYAILGYNTKGSSLNYMGKTNEAISVYLEGIDRYDDFPQLYYNLGLAYFADKDYVKAGEAYRKTLKMNPKHAGAHLNLGRTMAAMDKRIEGLLGLYYFLLLEPASDRSEWAFEWIQEMFYGQDLSDSDYSDADSKLLALLNANESSIKPKDTTFDLFLKDTKSFLSALDEIEETTNPAEATVWDNYISFFKALSMRGYAESFGYYISTPLRTEAEGWHKKNKNRLTNFARWLAQQE